VREARDGELDRSKVSVGTGSCGCGPAGKPLGESDVDSRRGNLGGLGKDLRIGLQVGLQPEQSKPKQVGIFRLRHGVGDASS
jgi:hypothetical protein